MSTRMRNEFRVTSRAHSKNRMGNLLIYDFAVEVTFKVKGQTGVVTEEPLPQRRHSCWASFTTRYLQ